MLIAGFVKQLKRLTLGNLDFLVILYVYFIKRNLICEAHYYACEILSIQIEVR